MNLHENTAFGRKVFFLNPPFDFQKIVIDKLAEMEYEIYIIDNIQYAKNVLRHFPDSICFIYIDSCMPPENWFNFVVSFENDAVLSTIFLGILSSRARSCDRELFLMHATIPAGFISTSVEYADLTGTICNILELNGAKGRRKYVRAECLKDPNLQATCTIGQQVYKLTVQNISSVGFACLLPAQYASAFQINSVVRNISITLYGKTITCSGAVIITKTEHNILTVVMLFLKGTPHSVKNIIREYIRKRLQFTILSIIQKEPPDTTDYSNPVDNSQNDASAIASAPDSSLPEEQEGFLSEITGDDADPEVSGQDDQQSSFSSTDLDVTSMF